MSENPSGPSGSDALKQAPEAEVKFVLNLPIVGTVPIPAPDVLATGLTVLLLLGGCS